ncbi:MAG TPA: 6-phosphogluconolactonase [Micropepsaceae bacterium]|nr:6-phosphogluconolactonase [Micropepsaceae bacterium]
MTGFHGRVEITNDAAALAHRVAEWLVDSATKSKTAFRVALSGGSTPKRCYELLASPEFRDRMPWNRVQWFWGDERFVPQDDPESNYRMAWEAMLSRVPTLRQNIFPVPTAGDPDASAAQYETTLKRIYGRDSLDKERPLFDVVLLGMGDDGHTASLIPDEPVLQERKHWVAAVAHGRPEVRITLTYPAIESSRHVAFLVQGEAKAAMFRAIRSGESDVPAARVRSRGEVIWFVDRAAAGEE